MNVYVFMCVCIGNIFVYMFPGESQVTIYATPNPFLLNEICLNHIQYICSLFGNDLGY